MTREDAIKVLERISEGTIQRDCSTCGRPTAGIYSGVCCYCSLCEVVPEILKDYHERKHFRSYWTWDGKRKNEALDMAISALRHQGQERNAPLTLDELQKMDGEPVYIVDGDVAWWDIVSFSLQGWLYLVKGKQFRYSRYGEWLAYRQKPEDVQK